MLTLKRCDLLARRRLLEEVGDVVSTAAGPGEWFTVLSQQSSHDAGRLVTLSTTDIA